MIKVLIDVDVLVDCFVRREQYRDSLLVLNACNAGKGEGWVSADSLGTLYHLLKRSEDEDFAREALKKMLSFLSVIPTRRSTVAEGLEIPIKDLEKAFQAVSLRQFHLDGIVTRSARDFRDADVPAYTPSEFLEVLAQGSAKPKEVPFLDLKAQFRDVYNDIDDSFAQIITNTSFVMGDDVRDFEKAFADYLGVPYVAAMNSGTSALIVALLACGVGPGDEIITVPNTFIATVEAISFVGARPVFVEVDPKTYTMDPAKIEPAITSRTKAILPVHLYGQSGDMEALLDVAGQYDLLVIEDACQAHGAHCRIKGEWVRAGTVGHVGCFSFYPGKNLGCYGEGGAAVTRDPDIAEKMERMRDHGAKEKYYHIYKGLNLRMENLQGAVLLVKLPHLDGWNQKRRENAWVYNEFFGNVGEIVPPSEAPYARHVYHLYVIQVSERDRLRAYLDAEGIGTGIHYPVPVHLQEAFKGLGYKAGDFPVSERLAERILSLPMYAELEKREIKRVVERIKDFLHEE